MFDAVPAASPTSSSSSSAPSPPVDTNRSKFDVVIDQVEVKLSLSHFAEGNGVVTEVRVKGVRGNVYRDHIDWNVPYACTAAGEKGFDFRFGVEDLLLKVNDAHRDYSVSILTLETDQLRYQFLLYDLLRSRLAIGSFDNCLFSVHARQETQAAGPQKDHHCHVRTLLNSAVISQCF